MLAQSRDISQRLNMCAGAAHPAVDEVLREVVENRQRRYHLLLVPRSGLRCLACAYADREAPSSAGQVNAYPQSAHKKQVLASDLKQHDRSGSE